MQTCFPGIEIHPSDPSQLNISQDSLHAGNDADKTDIETLLLLNLRVVFELSCTANIVTAKTNGLRIRAWDWSNISNGSKPNLIYLWDSRLTAQMHVMLHSFHVLRKMHNSGLAAG